MTKRKEQTDEAGSKLARQPAKEPSGTNLYSSDELRGIQDAIKAYQEIGKDLQRHRDEYFKIIGPALVLIRNKAFEVAGTRKVTSQAYRDAIGEELKRTGLDAIDKGTRSHLLKIMDNLSEVGEWLADLPDGTNNRLNHPKTIWQTFESAKNLRRAMPEGYVWRESEDEDYWGEEQKEQGADATAAGAEAEAKKIEEEEARQHIEAWLARHGSDAEPKPTQASEETGETDAAETDATEADATEADTTEAAEADATEKPTEAGEEAGEADATEAGEADTTEADEVEASAEKRKREHADAEAAAAGDAFTRAATDAFTRAAAAADDQDTDDADAGADADKPFPDMSPTYPKTIGGLQEYIEDAFRRGVSPDAKFFIQVDEGGNLEHCEVYFIDDDGCGDPPFMVVTPGNDDDADESDITTTTKVHRKVSLRYP
jgi:hypothetical protein